MYALSAVLAGHSADVRCCCMDAVGHIVTGSRDKTALVWEQNPGCDENTPAASKWRVMCKLTGHTGFVNAVATLKNTEQFPHGLIITAGQDKLINVYSPGISEPIKQLTGHLDGVTCLSTGWHGTLLSGSADCTVRVWEDLELKEVLSGHSAPVWDVAIYPGRGTYISASGDKSIRLWKNGKQEMIYEGHTDAVRKVVVLPDEETFVSCSNDGSVRHWSVAGPCLSVVQLGDSFLYSMCLLPGGVFAVSGEKGNLFILRDGAIQQGIQIPALSIWACEPLPGSDVLVGGSDGVARIFSPHEGKYAPLSDREQMSEQLAAQKHSKQAIGDLELSKLQGPEALHRPGKEGQTVMINREGTVEVYQYSGGSWQNLGVVQDAYDKEKHELDGKKYDHVINVDAQEDGMPPLKLGCNNEDDPWQVAQDFINKHLLSQSYLTEIAEYITKNTGVGNKPVELNSDFCDPLTGSGRYVLPSEKSGEGRVPTSTLGTPRYYPETKPLTESIPDASKLIKKISEHNALVNENQKLDDAKLAHFEKIAKKTSEGQSLESEDMALVAQLLSWDADRIFPCIDLARSINKAFPDFFQLQDKLQIAVANYKKTSVPCVRVALRFLVDITHQHTRQCVEQFVELVAPAMDCLNTTDKKFVCISLSKILYNMTCVESNVATSRHILNSITTLLQYIERELEEKDCQTLQFNLLVATGNLISRCGELKQFVKKPVIEQLTAAQFGKTKITANDILSALS